MNNPFVQQYLVLPLLKKKDVLYLAVPDPTLPILNDLKFLTGLNLRLLVVPFDLLQQTIDTVLNTNLLSGLGDLEDAKLDELNISAYEEEADTIAQLDTALDTSPIVRYVNKILLDAINKNASDIHFEH